MKCLFFVFSVPHKGSRITLASSTASQPPADLQALQHVQEVVHPRQLGDVLEDGHQQGGRDGDGAGEQHPGKTGPLQVQESLEENNNNVCLRKA